MATYHQPTNYGVQTRSQTQQQSETGTQTEPQISKESGLPPPPSQSQPGPVVGTTGVPTPPSDQFPTAMASLSNLVPRFNGTGNARQWLRKVECLRQHQKMTDEVYLNLLPLYLEGPAITWLDSLQPAPRTRAAFETAFKQRYVQDSASQTAFLGDQQRPDESGVAFIERVMEKTTGLEIPEVFLVQVILNGLSTDLKSIVMPQGARTLQALSDQVRLAQKTVDATKASSPNVSAVTTPDPALSQIAALLTDQQKQLNNLAGQLEETRAHAKRREQKPQSQHRQQWHQKPSNQQPQHQRSYNQGNRFNPIYGSLGTHVQADGDDDGGSRGCVGSCGTTGSTDAGGCQQRHPAP
ncbi:uncharacterized protein [Haliotis asinina]|uniref:uncharacterized protein n=1 Tax=Haliotis asinina TaxID=109174 RepID=UPI003531896A